MADLHRAQRESLGAYVVGGLEPADRDALRAHLETCAECRAEAAELDGVVRLLRSASAGASELTAVSPEPPSDLEERIMERVRLASGAAWPGEASRSIASEMASPIQISRRRRDIPRTLLALAAAVALFAAGIGVGWAVFRAPSAPPTESIAFLDEPAGIDADGVLIAHTWGTEANLVITGLLQDERYVVTFTAADGREVAGGTFIGISGRLVCKVNAAILRQNVTQLLITDSGGSEILSADLTT